jgi:hypothetical protein
MIVLWACVAVAILAEIAAGAQAVVLLHGKDVRIAQLHDRIDSLATNVDRTNKQLEAEAILRKQAEERVKAQQALLKQAEEWIAARKNGESGAQAPPRSQP